MTIERRFATIQLKRLESAAWEEANPILQFGEPGVEGVAGSGAAMRLKIGDGVTAWNDLPYVVGEQGIQGIPGEPLTVTTEDRPAANTVTPGSLRYDSDLQQIIMSNGVAWLNPDGTPLA